ncbi:MAG: hypothetical protein HYT72_03735 [Candidatus Aenigmarchaeota archaeon]|nr:hypothetical protein [Candidatus Aenigmarchaeota archaeon]
MNCPLTLPSTYSGAHPSFGVSWTVRLSFMSNLSKYDGSTTVALPSTSSASPL